MSTDDERPISDNARRDRLLTCLLGLRVGDAMAAKFDGMRSAVVAEHLRAHGALDKGRPVPWRYGDDTLMGAAVARVLADRGQVDPDLLATTFGQCYDAHRGFGEGTRELLAQLAITPLRWRQLGRELYRGQGSLGNGAAARAAPIGAYFADDPERVVDEATLAAAVTHTHPEAVDGAVAVALTTAYFARRFLGRRPAPTGAGLVLTVLEAVRTPALRRTLGQVHEMLARGEDPGAGLAGASIGVGERARDSVPFAIYTAVRHPESYVNAVTYAVRAGGDVGAIASMVGAIVAARGPAGWIPDEWRRASEPLPG